MSSSEENNSNSPPHLRMELILSDDRMQAELVVYYDKRFSFRYEDALELMNANEVVFGINHEKIKRMASDYRDENPNEKVFREVIAKAHRPVLARDAKLEIYVKPPPPVKIDASGRADFRNIQRFQTVNPNDKLATMYLPLDGKPGFNIHGQEVLPEEPKKYPLELGKNIIELPASAEDRADHIDYGARVHGIFAYSGQYMDVSPELVITSNVGLESGNIEYDGNIRIGNNIEREASVICLGDIKVGGMVESGNVKVGGSMVVDKGINTNQEHLLHVNGDLRAFYIDNSKLLVEGSIEINRSINASIITCMGDLFVADKLSNICGGETYTYGSLSTNTLGNRAETPTKVVLGNHVKNIELLKKEAQLREEMIKKYEKAKEDVIKIKNYATRMRGKIPDDKKVGFRNKFVAFELLKSQLQENADKINNLRKIQYNKSEIRLIVREMIYPGVVIHYRRHIEKIKAPQSRCILRFMPEHDGPIIEAYKKEDFV